jgi:hypothetical protein
MQHKLKPLEYATDADLPDFGSVHQNMVNEQSALAAYIAADQRGARKTARPALASAPPDVQNAVNEALQTSRRSKVSTASGTAASLQNLRRKKPRYLPKLAVEVLCGFGFAVFIFFNPLTFLALTLILLTFGVGTYFALGYDGFWEQMLRPPRWYVARRPDRAKRVHEAVDRFAMRWDAILDWFPEALVCGLYLPDVSNLAVTPDEPDTRFDLRLDELARTKRP